MLRTQCAVPLAMGELFVHPLEVEPLVSERLAARFPCDDRASLRPAPRLADGTSRPF